jgi:hypothetical protein
MSYEGYTQALCQQGHEVIIGQYEDVDACRCGDALVWFHSVDQTNGCSCDDDSCPAHRKKLEVKEAAKFKNCNACGHSELVAPTTYKMPARLPHE